MDFDRLERPRVLIIALSGIGNLLMASPLFRALKDANPTVEIDVLVAPRGTTDVLDANPRIRNVVIGTAKPSLGAAVALARRLRAVRYDIGIVTYPGQLVWSAGLLRLSGIPRRIGHRYSWAFLTNTSLFLSDPVLFLPLSPDPHSRSAHDVVQNLRLLEPLGIAVAPDTASYDFPLAPDDHARADTWLAEHGLTSETLIGFHPGGYRDLAVKQWPAKRWADLGDRLADDVRVRILVFSGPAEHALLAEICARMQAPSFPVRVPLRTAAALIGRCTLFVSNDSGLLHLAVSQNVRTFGIFGPTDERRTAPWGPHGQVIRAPGTQPSYDVAQLRRTRTDRGTHPTLLALSVDDVARVVRTATPVLHR